MSLKNKIKDYVKTNKTFSIADLYNEFGSDYEKHSIRARVYENSSLIRTSKGNYVLAGSELEAIIEQADTRDHIFEIKKANIYYDMMFFDIPYRTGGQKGGNRNLSDFALIEPEDFQEIIYEAQKMLRTEDSQVYFIIADGKSSRKDADRYTKAFENTSLKISEVGSYTKLTSTGKVCNMGKYNMPAEKIIAYSHSGNVREIEGAEHNLNFRLQRPSLPRSGGYKTEKPLEMLESLIKQSTLAGEWVSDMFAGSGVSLEAALKLKRKIHVIEYAKEAIDNFIIPRAKKFIAVNNQITNNYQPTLLDYLDIN